MNKQFTLIFLLFWSASCFSETDIDLISGEWESNGVYGKLKNRESAVLKILKEGISYQIDFDVYKCPMNYYKFIDELHHIRCFFNNNERIHLVLHGSKGKHGFLAGFEFWKGGIPNSPKSVYGGAPASFKLINGL